MNSNKMNNRKLARGQSIFVLFIVMNFLTSTEQSKKFGHKTFAVRSQPLNSVLKEWHQQTGNDLDVQSQSVGEEYIDVKSFVLSAQTTTTVHQVEDEKSCEKFHCDVRPCCKGYCISVFGSKMCLLLQLIGK